MNKEFDIEQSLLDKRLLNLLPDWWRNINKEDHYLVVTDDCDSLFSCQRLNTLFGLEIGGFYSFEKGLYVNNSISDDGWNTPIYVDLSIGQGNLCFDNHRTFIKNPNRVNPNVISREYKDKYNFSTLTFIIGLYGGIEQMNEDLRTMLLAVDGGFVGYYKDGGRWKDVNLFWLKMLGLEEYLLPILESHNMKYFQDFSAEHGLHDKVWINDDGYLETLTYRVPDYRFELINPIEKIYTSKWDAMQRHEKNENILVSAETYKNSYVLNIAV